MLSIHIEATELFDETTERFIDVPETELQLEHSLVSISKWESKWNKCFLTRSNKLTDEEYRDYIRCMTINRKVDPKVYLALQRRHYVAINDYIGKSQTATHFYDYQRKNGPSSESTTSELIYYWMFSYGIPIECERWHLSRLMALIEIFSRKNSKSKRMSKGDLAKRNRSLNAQRRAMTGSKG